jgi:hypothetical protein
MPDHEDPIQTAPPAHRAMAITTPPDYAIRERPALASMYLLVFVFSVLSIVIRVFPTIPNFTPLGALGLFAGSRVRGWKAYLAPIAVMVISDLGLYWLRGYNPFDPFVYASFLLNVVFGAFVLRKMSAPRLIGGAVFASWQFFVLVNFGCWLYMPETYPRSFTGLAACYAMAIPFSWQMLAGDLAFTAVFFGVYALATARRTAVAKVAA